MKRVSQLTELTTPAIDDYLPIVDTSTSTTKKIKVQNLIGVPDLGWTGAAETWAYSSWTLATKVAVITVPSDATIKYTRGMHVRFSQATGGTKYGTIMAVTSTTLTVLMEGSYILNNEAISTPVYSPLFVPLGSNAFNMGGWEEIGRNELQASADSISVTFPARKHLMILTFVKGTGFMDCLYQFNGDTANNYSYVIETNGGAGAGATSQNKLLASAGDSNVNAMTVAFVTNEATTEKHWNSHHNISSAGAGAGVTQVNTYGKWVNTSVQITSVNMINNNTGDYLTGSRIIVLGRN